MQNLNTRKPILKLLPNPVNGVIGKFLMDNTEYFKSIEDNLRKYGMPTHFDGGYFNGYVVVLPEHPFYGKDYDEIDDLLRKNSSTNGFYVHGGLTFANDAKTSVLNSLNISQIIGFLVSILVMLMIQQSTGLKNVHGKKLKNSYKQQFTMENKCER